MVKARAKILALFAAIGLWALGTIFPHLGATDEFYYQMPAAPGGYGYYCPLPAPNYYTYNVPAPGTTGYYVLSPAPWPIEIEVPNYHCKHKCKHKHRHRCEHDEDD